MQKTRDLNIEEQESFKKDFSEFLESRSLTIGLLPQYELIEGTNSFRTTVNMMISKKIVEPEVVKEEGILSNNPEINPNATV